MANKDQPIGFRTYGPILRVSPYDIDAATAIFINDLLDMSVNDGYPNAAAAGGTRLIGTSAEYRTSSSAAGVIYVPDDPQQLWIAQDNAGSTLAATNVGNMCDHVAGAGSSTTYLSGHELDSTSPSGSQATGFVIKGYDHRIDNAWGANVDLILLCYDHMYARGTLI